uniref:Uncharacterized protein n=1 Tax=Emiliania huxleyi (strain CCMP1516) TaxID=280463 RepID=A0A0D3JM58_EMIH1
MFASYGPTLRVAAPDAHVPQAPSSRWLTAIRAQHAQAPPGSSQRPSQAPSRRAAPP